MDHVHKVINTEKINLTVLQMRIFQSEKICTEVFRSNKPMLLNVKQFREKYMHVCTHMYIASYF